MTTDDAEFLTDFPREIAGPDLAQLFGCSVRMLTTLAQRGTVIRLRTGVYDCPASVQGYIASLRSAAAGRGGAGIETLTGERTRLASAQAEAAELKNATSRGELVLSAETERVWSEAMVALRSGLLSVPSRVRQKLPGLTAAEVAVIDAELRCTMAALGTGVSVE